jgi:hypothetical protein
MIRRFLIVLIVPFLICSCKKSEEDQMSSVPQQMVEATKVSITNWARTNEMVIQTNAQVFSQMVTGLEVAAHTFGMGLTNEIILENGRAGQFMKLLHDQDKLPGVSKDEHGVMTSDTFSFYSPSNNLDVVIFSNIGTTITYPVSRTFHLVKYGDTSTNNYTLVKEAKDAEWKLVRGWETDSNGQIIHEWPIQ